MKNSFQFPPRKAASRWIGSNKKHGLAIFAEYLQFTTYNRRTCLFKRIYTQKVNPDEVREPHSTKSFSNLNLAPINSRCCLLLAMPERILTISFFLVSITKKAGLVQRHSMQLIFTLLFTKNYLYIMCFAVCCNYLMCEVRDVFSWQKYSSS